MTHRCCFTAGKLGASHTPFQLILGPQALGHGTPVCSCVSLELLRVLELVTFTDEHRGTKLGTSFGGRTHRRVIEMVGRGLEVAAGARVDARPVAIPTKELVTSGAGHQVAPVDAVNPRLLRTFRIRTALQAQILEPTIFLQLVQSRGATRGVGANGLVRVVGSSTALRGAHPEVALGTNSGSPSGVRRFQAHELATIAPGTAKDQVGVRVKEQLMLMLSHKSVRKFRLPVNESGSTIGRET